MPRAIEVNQVPGVEASLSGGDPGDAAARIRDLLAGGADPTEVVRTAALAAARHFSPSLPPPHALPALGAALDLASVSDPPEAPILQACALAAVEWRDEPLPPPKHAVSGDELHLGRSFLVAVRARDLHEADAIFTGLLREGKERRLAGDVLFQACTEDAAGDGRKLAFAVGSWQLARALGWRDGTTLVRPAVHLAAGTEQDLSAYSALLRQVGRARLDLELAARNVSPVDDTARNAYEIAVGAGPDRVVTELLAGLRRGRAPSGYADLVAATAAEHLVRDPAALEPALFALAARFVLGFSRTAAHVNALLLAARSVAQLGTPTMPQPARISEPQAALRDLEAAIEGGVARDAAALALGLVDAVGPGVVAPALHRQAVVQDAYKDAGHRLIYASWSRELAAVAPGPALASLAALLARTPKSRTVVER